MPQNPLLSIVLPTRNAAAHLGRTLTAIEKAGSAFDHECVVADGGSTDDTAALARRHGATVLSVATPGRGAQLCAGAAAARGEWLFFLHADTAPGPEWAVAAKAFMDEPDHYHLAACFRFALASGKPAARRIERLVAWRSRVLGLPYGDQGLLLSRALYDEIGGFSPIPIMEDIEIVRRLGKARLVLLDAPLPTSAERYDKEGYWRRPLRNLFCLALYFLGVSTERLRRLYG
ncbi:MAG: TIGR04283 family arsenosugar biosynthesis glycosyltransferase [Alphaproteobacteria bacterium]|nr:TIGR04283 family arsenosugar biosynthesis glycosyltransferase [Alphaproteobacteria bacterium]